MRVQRYRIAGEQVTVRNVETSEDTRAFLEWCRSNENRPIAFDTETTGLDIFAPGFRVRLVQFGTEREAWVLPVDPLAGLVCAPQAAVREALETLPFLLAHNAKFDALAVWAHLGVELTGLWRRITDTRILAHLLDPRGPQDPGGIGQGLKPLCARHVDPDAPDTQAGLYGEFRKIGHTKETGWAAIDIHNPLYTLYAGLDVILTARLFRVLGPLAQAAGYERLSEFEHAVALVCARMEAKGFLLDVEYTETLAARLLAESDEWSAVARRFGVSSVNAPAQISAALEGMGETLTETTESGALKVDKEVLLPLADLDRKWQRIGAREPNYLADAVLRAKRASKWKTSYADAMLSRRDAHDRIHPDIASLQARTARMSISRPPLQQLPSGDWVIRRAMQAEPGCVVGTVDYQAVELRVLAALSGDVQMTAAIHAGRDLHGFTAELIYGPGFTEYHRKVCKGIGFGKVYGGGPDTLARQTGAPLDQVKAAIRAYDRAYAGVRRYSKRLQNRAEWGAKEVITPSGRRLPLDRRRLYGATNYMVQSTSRDVLAEALLRLDERGLTDFLRLPVHDEVVFVAPAEDAKEIGHEIQTAMAVPDFFGVPLTTDLDIGGRTWGSLYGAAA
ncbi:DNA polymerase [Amycolatopsis sp. NPDC051071]|uniref:DNA polymerase n=1 Tax=Amycolatopsis sp. NPDC051071 TaxID=3154637 RepID=UPI0034441DBF